MNSRLREHWLLDPSVTYLNHGAFGACPREVLAKQGEIRERLEREPVQFFIGTLEKDLDEVRARLGEFLHADPTGIVFVSNATTGVATVLQALHFEPGDEILLTNHTYAACVNVAVRRAEDTGAKVVTAEVPFPTPDASVICESIFSALTPRTKLVLVDHVTSPTAVVLPIEKIVREVQGRGVDVLVDGAHAPGMLPLDLEALGAAYYTANFHKWCCAPKGAAMLHVRRDRRTGMRPLVASHGMSAWSARPDRTRYFLEFDWTGTQDPSPALSIPAALDFLEHLLPGGHAALRKQNRDLALEARALVAKATGLTPGCSDALVGSMAAFLVPKDCFAGPEQDLYRMLFERCIEVPILSRNDRKEALLRFSVQAYNELSDYERLADALKQILS